MLFKALSVLLSIGSVLALTPLESRIQTENSLMDIMLMPRAADPVVQQYCFNRYIPLLKKISDDFEAEYSGCQSDYDNSAKLIDAAYVKERENATSVSKESCQSLQKCDSIENYADAFDCFGNIGLEQSQYLSGMAGISTLSAVEIRKQYSTVASTRDGCFVTASNTYNKNHINTNTEMQNCLNGNIVTPPIEETTIPN